MEDMEENGEPDSFGGDLGACPDIEDGENDDPIIPWKPDIAWWNIACWLDIIVISQTRIR